MWNGQYRIQIKESYYKKVDYIYRNRQNYQFITYILTIVIRPPLYHLASIWHYLDRLLDAFNDNIVSFNP